MSTIIILVLMLIMLMPSTEMSIKNKLFKYEYSSDSLYRRHKQFFNYIRFHWWKLDAEGLYRFYVGGYISEWQYKKLWHWFKF